MLRRYEEVVERAPKTADPAKILAYLNERLPPIWAASYCASTPKAGQLLTVTLDDQGHPGVFVKTMFDLRQGSSERDDRVIAVWGLSRQEPAATRDKSRMAGFIKDDWSKAYPGRDRGHFFAHTMGGGVDINLFPQLASINRGGDWRAMEKYAVEHPGSLCFIQPLYRGATWTPDRLIYGIFKMPPNEKLAFFGKFFQN
jgi:hypothetical protein